MKKSEKLIKKLDKYDLHTEKLSEVICNYVLSNYTEQDIEKFVKRVNSNIGHIKANHILSYSSEYVKGQSKLTRKLEKYQFRKHKLADLISDYLFNNHLDCEVQYFVKDVNNRLGHYKANHPLLDALDGLNIRTN